MKNTLVVISILCLGLWFSTGCNVSGDGGETDGPECVADSECDNGYCLDNECVGCVDDGHCSDGVCHQNNCVGCVNDDDCPESDICRSFQCLSGCEDVSCGSGGSCVDDGGELYCECDEGYFDSDLHCQSCDCDIDNGIATCDENGDCYVIECDDGFIESGDQCLSCECDVENGEGACDDDNQCYIAGCDEGYTTEDDDPATGCECATSDTPDPINFTDENCDGLDGDMSTAIFVSPFGNDGHDGDPHRPVASIQRGIDLASASSTHHNVFIAQGEYNETIRVEEATGLYGGYIDLGGGQWDRNANNPTTINGQDVSGGHRPVEITGIDDDMEIQLLTIRADDAPTETVNGESIAGSSVGITLYDNNSTVSISHSLIVAESGQDGANGTANIGETGGDGTDADEVGTSDNAGKSGGTTNCSYSANTFGGTGGIGGTSSSNNGQPGSSGSGSQGGSGGAGGSSQCSTSPNPNVLGGGNGANGGATGQAGADADPPSPTSSLASPSGSSALTLYLGQNGPDGEHGTSGAGGGGGGGMGFYEFDAPVGGCIEGHSQYPGGAGGGAGGCGGQGGGGGKFGGASVAIMAHSSSIFVSHTELRTDVGGDGGNGHPGGSGGDGGSGGAPVIADGEDFGGGGGDGRRGGDGGAGAGGEGGASVGILHFNSSVDTEEVTFDRRRGGFGGSGPGSAGDGPDGIEADIHGL